VTEANMVMLIKRKGFWECDTAMLSYRCFGGTGLNLQSSSRRATALEMEAARTPVMLPFSFRHGLVSYDWTGYSYCIFFDLAMHTTQRKYCNDTFSQTCLAKFGNMFDDSVNNESLEGCPSVTERRPRITCLKL